ncbi:MAG: T9SS type A sorting domain-containing protein [Bacteroidetes bacterium]|nr:T9SS type A sorting domain-containing protein [Bacteroidota bacterium]
MKKNTLLILFFIALIKFTSSAQTTYTWNGSTSTAWNTNTNWTPNGVPTSADNAVIVTGANNCILAANTTITNLTITSGLLNLNGFTLNTTGVVACNSGTCSNGTFNSTATQLTFAGTLFNADVTANVTEIYFNGSTFNGSVTVSKNGSTNNAQSNGNNTFNGTTSITNAGTGYLLLTNGGAGRIDVFNAPATFSTSNTGNLYIGYNRSMDINANVFVNNASTGQVYLGNNATSTVNLNSGITITCGAFTDGALRINRLVQTGSTALNLLPGSAGAIHINNSVINGSLTVDAGLIIAQTSTFATAVNYSVSGTIMNNWSSGGNVYNGVLTVNNSSNGYFGFANGTPDTYNDDVYAYNTSTTGGRIIFSNNCTSQFNGNLYVSQTGNISGGGIAVGWSGTYPLINFAAGKSVIINGTYNSGYLQLYRIQQTDATPFNITASGNAAITLQDNICLGVLNVSSTETVAVTLRDNVFHAAVTVSLTDNSSAVLRENISHGAVTVSSPNLYPQGGTYNAPVVFTKTGGGGGNHNSGYQNIFNSTLEVNNQNGGGYLMLSYQSNDQFNDDITVSSTGTATGISFGWDGGTGTPVLAAGKSIFVGAGGYTSGYLRLGSFTQLGNAPINLTLTGTAYLQVLQPNIPCTFGGAFNITAPDIYIRGGVFNGAAEFTKTGGVDNHNNGNSNTFNSTCTINQQSTTGYFMLGYNSADIFNDDITVTNTGSRAIQLGWTGGTGSLTLATGKTVKIGAAGFSGSILYFGGFTQLGNAPVNLPLTGTATTLSYRSSTFGGNINSTSGNLTLNGSTFNGNFIAEKTGSASDDNPGGNTFNGICDITNNGTGYFAMGNGSPDVWNDDATFTNNSVARLIYLARGSAGNIFAGNLTLNSTGSASGINICSNGASTATLFATKTIITNTFTSGYLSLPRFTQLGNAPVTLSLTSTADYLQYGPNSTFGGNVTSTSQRLLFNGCTFNGTTDCIKTGGTGDYSDGGNIFNGVCNITNNGTNFLLLGNSNPDVWNDDVTFTNNSTDRILPAYATAGNIFNGNIYVNTSGGGTGINFCSQSVATATLAAGKTIASGTVGLNSGYLILQKFTQLGNAPVTLSLSATASYLQFGPSSELGGNVISVSPRVLFRGCTFLGTTNCTKTGSVSDVSNSSNTFSGTSVITNYGSGTMYFGNLSTDAFMSDATFNNLGTSDMYVADNSSSNVFGGVVTFSNAPSGGNVGIHISRSSVGTVFNDDIIVSNAGGSGVWFCGDGNNISNATISTVTLSAGKTISIGSAGFNAGRLMLKQFTQLGATAQTLSITAGAALLQLGPSSRFDGDVDFNFPRVQLHGATYNGVTTITKNGASDETGNGGNVFNGTTTITNSGSGYLYTGNGTADQFNGITTMNNTGSDSRIYFAHNHNGQTTTFTQPLTLNAAKTGGTNAWSYLISEGTNSHVSFDDVTMNIGGTLQSNLRILQGTGATATYNGNLTINLSNNFAAGTQIQLGTGTNAVSNYNGNIILNSTTGVTGSGVYFNTVASASSTLASTKFISIGGSGFTSGTLLLRQFTQLGATAQTLSITTGNAILQLGPSSRFDGDVDFSFPQVLLHGAVYNGITSITKNGGTSNAGNGGNVFNGTTTITNSGSGYLYTGNGTADQFNGVTTMNSTGSDSRIYFAHNHNGQTTAFTQPLTLNAAKTGGADTWSYLISEGTNSHVSFDDVTMNIGGTLQSNLRILQGTGATATYNGNLTINLSNTFASGTQIQLGTGTNAVSNYNGNIILNSTTGVAGSGVYFNTVASASSTLASTKFISIGGSGFTSGNLSIPRFTQLGTATQSLVQTSGTALLTSGPSNTFNGPVDFNFPQINLTNSTYNNTAVIEKNGATVNLCTGNNTFNSTTTITNSHATDYLRLANSTADTYNGDVTFVQTTAGLLQPNYNTNCTYAGNITVSAPTGSAITFGTGGSGRATLTGGTAQTINRSNGEFPNFTRLTLNKSGSDVTLNTSINVINDLTFANGIMNSSPSNILVMKNASSTTIGSGNSHINGAMDYEMATNSGARRVLNFPIGNSGEWRPVVLQVSHNTTTNYTYRADVTNADAHALGWAIPGTITHVSHAHYWDIERRNTTTGVAESATDLRITAGAAPIITLYYDANDGVTDAAFLTVCKNTSAALTTWIDIGGTGASNTTGNVTSTSAPAVFNSFSRFTLGNKINGLNPLPIKLLYFTAVPVDNKTVRLDWATASEKDNHHFEIERSIDGINFENVSTVPARRNGNSSTKQDYSTNDEKPYKGISYYRLKQVDKSGGFNYAKLVDVSINANSTLSFYPNPASNYIYFSGNKDLKHTTVKVLNSLGALVIHEMNLSDKDRIDVSNLAEGIYYIQVSNQGEMEQSVKISVQK